MSKYILSVESCLDWDDSERRTEVLGTFDVQNRMSLLQLIDGYWIYGYQEELTEKVADGVLASLNPKDPFYWGQFDILENTDDTYKHRYKFELTLLEICKMSKILRHICSKSGSVQTSNTQKSR